MENLKNDYLPTEQKRQLLRFFIEWNVMTGKDISDYLGRSLNSFNYQELKRILKINIYEHLQYSCNLKGTKLQIAFLEEIENISHFIPSFKKNQN